NMGVVPPASGFLEGLREITTSNDALLLLDEVITGFRVGRGGAQERFGITPDLTTLGKIIGGGFPLAAYGGRREIMDMISPSGPVYQAGTLSGNPVATAAGLATLEQLTPEVYQQLDSMADRLAVGLQQVCARQRVPASLNRVGSMMTLFFNRDSPTDFTSVTASDTALYAAVHQGLLRRGVYFPPSAFEAFFVSTAHTEADIDATLAAFGEALGDAVKTRP
ncbi:MAG: aminotransferase class III-fold pyridoxal phosphate-dependent enzyme, partial [Chloroflexi bacterium]|nr:aminotransferase class III-fold pyridoxal phosphate-dependent enzyme [Chloroflexota bacterium]